MVAQRTRFTILYQYSTDCGGNSEAPYGGNIYVPGDTRPFPLVPFPDTSACGGQIQVTAFGVDA